MDSSFNSPGKSLKKKNVQIHESVNVNRVSIKYEWRRRNTTSATAKKNTTIIHFS